MWRRSKSSACSPPATTVSFFGVGASGFGYRLNNVHKQFDFGTARARGGVLINDTLWYATGGLAWGTVEDKVTWLGSATPAIFPGVLAPGPFLDSGAKFVKTRVGWTLGAGAETKLDARWSAKLEYLYVDLGHVNETFAIAINPAFGPAFTTGGALATRTVHNSDHIIRLGLNYKLF